MTSELIGVLLVSVSVLLILWCFIKKTEYFFNMRNVIINHLALFKKSKVQYLVFYVFPLTFSVGLAILQEVNKDFFSILSVVLSIIVSILFAILSILCGQDYSSVIDNVQKKYAIKVMKQTINAIIFTSFLSMFLLLCSLIFVVVDTETLAWTLFDIVKMEQIISGVVYYTFTVILLNLFLIIKYMSKLIEFNLIAPKKEK